MIEQSKERIGQLIDYWTAKAKWHERWPEGQGLAAEALARIYADTVSSLHRLAEPPVVTPPNEATRKYLESMAAIMRDAERYRWIRDANPNTSDIDPGLIPTYAGTKLDEGIDHALALTNPEAHSKSQQKRYATQRGESWDANPRLEDIVDSENWCPQCAHPIGACVCDIEKSAPDCPHCDGFLLEGTVLHGPRCPEVSRPACSHANVVRGIGLNDSEYWMCDCGGIWKKDPRASAETGDSH